MQTPHQSEQRSASSSRIPEILAPAGGRAQFFAALNCGADAVYLGLKEFNARSRAENFSIEDLFELVPLAHRFDMKVLVTMNILIKDVELDRLYVVLAQLVQAQVDAIIVQDIGLVRVVKEHFPELRMHASTQMAVHNIHGVRQAIDWGLQRVVLARELTAAEIGRIRKQVPRDAIEIEAFCHGSLCYSYSGLCFFSGSDHGRSGNRGECAYTCREPYKIVSEAGQGFLFSMRDLDTADHLQKFIETGVDTLKIEGRKKDAQFVSSVVKLYREKLNQAFGSNTLRKSAPPAALAMYEKTYGDASLRNDLSLSFQRKPTSFFFLNRYKENVIDLDNPSHAGIRLGTITRIKRNQDASAWIKLRLQAPVQSYDGLSIRPAEKIYHAKPQDGAHSNKDLSGLVTRYEREEIEFSLRTFKVNNKSVFEAKAGDEIEIYVPEKGAQLDVGMAVNKLRSSELKARVEGLSQTPKDYRLRQEHYFDLSVDLKASEDKTQASCRLDAKVLGESFALDIPLAFTPAQKPEAVVALIKKDLSVFGPGAGESGQVFYVADTIDVHNPDNVFVPSALLKQAKAELRKAFVSRMSDYCERRAHLADTPKVNLKNSSSESRFQIKFDRSSYIATLDAYLSSHPSQRALVNELVFEPKRDQALSEDMPAVVDTLFALAERHQLTLRCAIPMVIRAWDEPLLSRFVQLYRERGGRSFELANAGATYFLRSCKVDPKDCDLSSDFSFYALNRHAVTQLDGDGVKQIALSIEDDRDNLDHLLQHWPVNAAPQAILYKDTPLFIAEACSLTALHNGCPTASVCGYRTLEIENRKGERFYVAHEGCKSIVYAKEAYAIPQFRKELERKGVKHFRIDFLTRPYTEQALERILSAAFQAERLAETHSANYERELL